MEKILAKNDNREGLLPMKQGKEQESKKTYDRKNIEVCNFIKNSHIFFEKLHPFEDGNGRTGRILMNLQKLNEELPLLIIHEGEEQMEYYKWFKEKR